MYKKTVKQGLLLLLGVIFCVYVCLALYLGIKSINVVKTAFGNDNDAIASLNSVFDSECKYDILIKSHMYDLSQANTETKYSLSLPIVIHWFSGAKVWIFYDHQYIVDGVVKSATSGGEIIFCLKRIDNTWKITDYRDPVS